MSDSVNCPTCPNCHAELPADSPRGLCPACLLQAGLPEYAETNVTPPGAGFVPPDVGSLSQQLDQLEVLELIGCGGMGAVYKARQVKLDRLVALKVLRPESAEDASFAQRFEREARTLARLSHPNIIGVHDFGELVLSGPTGRERRLFYFVMEYVDGRDLRRLMDDQPERDDVLAVAAQICDALQYAHEQGVVHRDIKPENILVTDSGVVKIADFGLAKLTAQEAADYSLTGTHQVMGTPRYMAPEQMVGSREVDHRADLYSLGVLLYEMLTGEVPLGRFEAPSRRNSDVDARFDEVVLRAMDRDPARRQQSAAVLRQELLQLAGGRDDAGGIREGAGVSTMLEVNAARALRGLRDRVTGRSRSGVSIAAIGLVTVTILWAVSQVGLAVADRVYSGTALFADAAGVICFAAAVVTGVTVLFLLMFGNLNHGNPLRSIVLSVFALTALILNLIYMTNRWPWQETGLYGGEHRAPLLIGIPSLLAIVILVLAAVDFRAFLQSRVSGNGGMKKKVIPETARVSFIVPAGVRPGPFITAHFQMLGYQPVRQTAAEWEFERGTVFGHMGVDLRKCFTRLTVRTGARPDGSQWVSCAWAVQAFVTASEVPRLEAEGEGLARALGVETLSQEPSGVRSVAAARSIVSVFGSSSRSGVWKPSSRVNIVSVLGGCEVDFRQALLEPGVTSVQVVGVLGTVGVVVPSDISVEVIGTGIMGIFRHDAGSSESELSSEKILRITGVSVMGKVSVHRTD